MYYDFLYFLQQNMIIFSDYYTKIPKLNIWWTNANYKKKMYIKVLFYVQKLSCHRSVVLMPTQTFNQVWYLPYVTHCYFENKNYVIPLSYHHSEFSKCFFFYLEPTVRMIIPPYIKMLDFHWIKAMLFFRKYYDFLQFFLYHGIFPPTLLSAVVFFRNTTAGG